MDLTESRALAAGLIQRFPDVVQPLRDGRLCLTTMASLSRVLTPENRAEVLPRFFNRSGLEAKAIAAELCPVASPPTRTVVTAVPARTIATASMAAPVADDAGGGFADECARSKPGEGGRHVGDRNLQWVPAGRILPGKG